MAAVGGGGGGGGLDDGDTRQLFVGHFLEEFTVIWMRGTRALKSRVGEEEHEEAMATAAAAGNVRNE